MKRILITGSNSYVGRSLMKWLEKYLELYSVDAISVRDDSWIRSDFSKYDVVFHVAGIAHLKENKKNTHLYYKVNRDLAFEIAKKAKSEGVKQFIFLSSMSVYGIDAGVIDETTPPKPKSNYGKSKLQAEDLIKGLADDTFKVANLRPPMIYGKGCKGNYPRLAKMAKITPFFPNIVNKRSMIYIDNLCEFVRLLIDDCSYGIFFPQNDTYVCTSEMVNMIAEVNGKKIRLTKIINPLLRVVKNTTVNKVFGDLVYAKTMSDYKSDYHIYHLESSISRTERGN